MRKMCVIKPCWISRMRITLLSGLVEVLRTPCRDERRQELLRANHSESAVSRSWLSLSPSF